MTPPHTPTIKSIAALTVLSLSVTTVTASAWEYSTETDRMSGKSNYTAMADSDNSLSLPFPYHGKNKGWLIVMKHSQHGLNVAFKIDKGQLMCRSYSPCRIQVKFGDGQPITFSGSSSADHDSTVAILSSPQKFIDQAKKTQNILVQFTVYNGGSNLLEFSFPAALVWDQKRPQK